MGCERCISSYNKPTCIKRKEERESERNKKAPKNAVNEGKAQPSTVKNKRKRRNWTKRQNGGASNKVERSPKREKSREKKNRQDRKGIGFLDR